MNIVSKIEKAKLIGRGGGCFPTAAKWKMVNDAKGDYKFVVCNAAEGEPDVMKDGYLLEKYPERVVEGMKLAMDYIGAYGGVIFLNSHYYKKVKQGLLNAIGDTSIEIFVKPKDAGYIAGEETSVLNTIEGKRTEPRLRPPFPPTNGLYNYPTILNNVETFYNVSLVAHNEFENTRFFSINGDCLWTGVYEFPAERTIRQVLEDTHNFPNFDFFVQIGGGASGEVLNSSQIDQPASGAASITVYSKTKYQPIEMLRKWVYYFAAESCGQCVPCREGTYRLKEIVDSKEPNWELFEDLLYNLSESSFCGLGCAVSIPIKSYMRNVLNSDHLNKDSTCSCFTS